MSWLGNLSWKALDNGPIVLGGDVTMLLAGLAVVGILTYKRRWRWLYKDWLTSLDPKKIGVMYLVIALVMLLRGAVDAGMMRAQQATNAHFLAADHFQQIFSAHGTIMIFFVAMGLMFGLINLIVPLQLGARDVAFPFLNSVSFWLFASGMALINLSLIIGQFSAAGWLAYPPLSELAYSPGVGVDYWIWALQIAGIGSLLAGINFLVTILRMRRLGMTLMKMPLFSWSVLCSMVLVIFAFPILTGTLAMLALDRTLGMHFFTAGGGGNAMMYVNLIWAWGHPEVYILILPAFGVFSEVVATFSRKPIFGYTSMVWALIAITFLSYTVWLHHFFTMGAGADVNAFFGVMTMVIAIPTGVKIFNWLFTMYRGRIKFATPMLWFLGFVVTFSIGGMAGVMMAVPAIDFQVHNSLFLVAHFHTMIVGGVVFGFFAGLTYWFPKIFGFMLNEKWGRYAFWCWFVGFLLAFGPLYILGLMGATRRLDHYDPSLGWQGLFVVAALGAAIIFAGVGCQIIQLIVSIRDRHKNVAGPDPWNGRTLEWATTSPPPFYNFATMPAVQTRDDFWDSKKHPREAAPYESFLLPRNSVVGPLIGLLSLVGGFGIVWHIWWAASLSLLAIITTIIIRISNDDTEYRLTAKRVEKLEAERA